MLGVVRSRHHVLDVRAEMMGCEFWYLYWEPGTGSVWVLALFGGCTMVVQTLSLLLVAVEFSLETFETFRADRNQLGTLALLHYPLADLPGRYISVFTDVVYDLFRWEWVGDVVKIPRLHHLYCFGV